MVILASTTLMLLLYLKSDPSLSLTVGMQSVSHGKKKSVNSSQLQENSKMTSFLTDETNKIPTKRARKLIFFSYICCTYLDKTFRCFGRFFSEDSRHEAKKLCVINLTVGGCIPAQICTFNKKIYKGHIVK